MPRTRQKFDGSFRTLIALLKAVGADRDVMRVTHQLHGWLEAHGAEREMAVIASTIGILLVEMQLEGAPFSSDELVLHSLQHGAPATGGQPTRISLRPGPASWFVTQFGRDPRHFPVAMTLATTAHIMRLLEQSPVPADRESPVLLLHAPQDLALLLTGVGQAPPRAPRRTERPHAPATKTH